MLYIITMQTLNIVAGVIYNIDGKFLISKRAAHSSNAGLWEFPGGKIEQNETPENALAREIKEELNLTLFSIKHFLSYEIKNETVNIHFTIFTCKTNSTEILLSDHDEIRWVNSTELPSEELFIKADIPILEKITEARF